MPKSMTIHSFFPEDEGCEVLEVDVSPTRGSSTVLPCGTSGSPLASPQTPSLLQKDEEAYGHDHPFPFPEEGGELLRRRLGMVMATPSFCLKKGETSSGRNERVIIQICSNPF